MTTKARAEEIVSEMEAAIKSGDAHKALEFVEIIDNEDLASFIKIDGMPARGGWAVFDALRDDTGNDDAASGGLASLSAEPTPTNSAEATMARDNLLTLFGLVEQAEDVAETALADFNTAELWSQLTDADGNTFATLADFVEADPPYGLGLDPNTLEPLDESDDPPAPRSFGDTIITRHDNRPGGIGWGNTSDDDWESVEPPPEGIDGRLIRTGRR